MTAAYSQPVPEWKRDPVDPTAQAALSSSRPIVLESFGYRQSLLYRLPGSTFHAVVSVRGSSREIHPKQASVPGLRLQANTATHALSRFTNKCQVSRTQRRTTFSLRSDHNSIRGTTPGATNFRAFDARFRRMTCSSGGLARASPCS